MCYKAISFREFQKILRVNGYSFIRKRGSHCIYHSKSGRQLVINEGAKQTMMIHLIKEYGLAAKV